MLIVVIGRSFWSRSRSCAIFIEPPFSRSDRASRDDADGLLPEGVDDRQLQPARRQPDRRLPLLTAQHLGAVEMDERIEEDLAGVVERDAVLPEVALRLLPVPVEANAVPFMSDIPSPKPTTVYIRCQYAPSVRPRTGAEPSQRLAYLKHVLKRVRVTGRCYLRFFFSRMQSRNLPGISPYLLERDERRRSCVSWWRSSCSGQRFPQWRRSPAPSRTSCRSAS